MSGTRAPFTTAKSYTEGALIDGRQRPVDISKAPPPKPSNI